MQHFKKLLTATLAATLVFSNISNVSQPLITEAAETSWYYNTIDNIFYKYQIGTDETTGESYVYNLCYSSGASKEKSSIVIPSTINGMEVRSVYSFTGTRGHSYITSITVNLDDHDLEISSEAFRGCTNLKSFTAVGAHTLTIQSKAFVDTPLEDITLDCDVKMENEIFGTSGLPSPSPNTTLRTLTFNGNVELVGSLTRCDALTDVYFNGESINIGTSAFYGSDPNLHFSEDNETVILGSNAMYYANNTKPIDLEFLGKDVYCYSGSISGCESVTFNNTGTTYIYDDFLNSTQITTDTNKTNRNIKSVVFNSKNVLFGSAENSEHAFRDVFNLESITFGFNTENVSGTLSYKNGYVSVADMYFLNLDCKVDLVDKIMRENTVYGNTMNTSLNSLAKYTNFKSVQSDLEVNFKNHATYLEGNTLADTDLEVIQHYVDGSSNTVPAATANSSGYTVTYYDSNGNKSDALVAGSNTIVVDYYASMYGESDITAYEKQIMSCDIEYVGGTKIEGQTVTKDDFKIRNVVYNNNTTKEELSNDSFEITNADTPLVVGDNVIKFSIDGKETNVENKAITFTLSQVEAKAIESLEVSLVEGATGKFVGDSVTKDDFVVKAVYNDGSVDEDYKDYGLANSILTTETNVITFTSANGKTAELTYKATPVSMVSIKAEYTNPKYGNNTAVVGQKINTQYVKVTATYNNGNTEVMTEGYSFDVDTITASGLNVIKVYCSGFETDLVINGVNRKVESMQVTLTSDAAQKAWVAGDKISKDDFVVNVVYNDGTSVICTDYVMSTDTLVKGDNIINFSITSSSSSLGSITLVAGETVPTPTETPDVVPTETPDVVPSETPDVVPTETPDVVPSDKPTPTPDVTPSETPTETPDVIPSVTPAPVPSITPAPVPDATPDVTLTPVKASVSIKTNLSNLKLLATSAKTKYSVVTNKKITLKTSAQNTKVYYQIVKSGKKLSSSAWKKIPATLNITKAMKATVYIKCVSSSTTVIKKTTGFFIDKTKPTISVSKKGKLTAKDSGSGIKSIKVNGKTVKNGKTLAKGTYKIVATDKAGNKKSVSVIIK